ncbi:hypothetical protein RFI_39738, partial [Reticulomyxa filosa]
TYRETKMESMKEEEELTIGKELYEVMTEQTNKIGQIFDGMEVNTMQCEHCGHCLRVFERFRYLVCPVVSRNQVLPIICIHNDFLTFEKLMLEVPSTMAIDKLKNIIAEKTEYYKEHISRKRVNWYIGSISEKVKAQTQVGSESSLELDIRRIPDDMEIGQFYKRCIFAIYYPEYNSQLFDVLCVEVKIEGNDKLNKRTRMVSLLQLQKDKYTGKELMSILADKFKQSNWYVSKIFMDNKLLLEYDTIKLPITTHLLIVLSNSNNRQNEKSNTSNKHDTNCNNNIDENKKYNLTLLCDCDAMAREFYFYFFLSESQVCKSGANARATVEEQLKRINNIMGLLEYLQKQGKENTRDLKQLPIVMQFCDYCDIDYRIFSTKISQSTFIKEQISSLKSIANKLNSSLHDRKLLQQCAEHVLAQMPTFNQDEICLHSLDECIQQVLGIEYAHGKNWNFECNCKRTSTITLQKKLLVGPQYLIIHLKRAKTDQYNFTSAITHSPSWSRTNSYSHSSSKYNHNVSFKEEFILNSQTYQLCG